MAETEGRPFSRPGGTRAGAGDNPALKRRAIVALSRRDEAGATPKTATGTGALPSNVPAGRPMAVWGGRTGQRVFESQNYANNIEIKIRGQCANKTLKMRKEQNE